MEPRGKKILATGDICDPHGVRTARLNSQVFQSASYPIIHDFFAAQHEAS